MEPPVINYNNRCADRAIVFLAASMFFTWKALKEINRVK